MTDQEDYEVCCAAIEVARQQGCACDPAVSVADGEGGMYLVAMEHEWWCPLPRSRDTATRHQPGYRVTPDE